MTRKTVLRITAGVCLLCLGMPGLALADRIAIGQQAKEAEIALPRSGITRDTVRDRYGSPQFSRGPVGQPPITVWDYPAFTVYFEEDRVIHSVVKPRG